MPVRTREVIRMRDIAAELGVSVITVSKVLRNEGRISKQMRERVLKRAQELNYRPDLTARSLATGRTYLIGMVVPDLMHPFFAAIAKELARNLRKEGYSLVISSADEDPTVELQLVESLLARRVDTLVLAASEHSKSSNIFNRIKQAGIPYLLLDRPIPGLNCPFVGSDDKEIGKLATMHLFERGYKQIAHIGLMGPNTGKRRLEGYRKVIEQHGMRVSPNHVVLVDSGDERGEVCGYTGMQKLLKAKPRPDAVYCYNDIIAAGAMKAVLEAGLEIPRDMALIGTSNLAGLSFWTALQVPLSTIDQDIPQLAAETTRQILAMQNQSAVQPPTKTYVPLKLVVRQSS